MDNSLQEKYLPFIQKHWLPLALGLGGFVFLLYGLISLSMPKDSPKDILFESAKDESSLADTQSKTEKKPEITVDIEGAVLKPGVYQLPAGSRIQDGLIVAGGMSPQADRIQIAKALNLAAKLTDGTKVYIPLQGERVSLGSSQDSAQGVGVASGQINLNTATEKDLDSLPGVGVVTAGKIIAARPYSSVDELLQKKIVGQKVFSQIKDKITVY